MKQNNSTRGKYFFLHITGRNLFLAVLMPGILVSSLLSAKTLVKMAQPAQAADVLKVVVLFDEEVPEGVPIVLGLMAYDVTGGFSPYTYEWLQNGKVVGTEEVVVITPAKDDSFTLRATDRNHCVSLHDFNMKVIQRTPGDEVSSPKRFRVFPTLVREGGFQVKCDLLLSDKISELLLIDSRGNRLMHYTFSNELAVLPVLVNGIYYAVIRSGSYVQVEKLVMESSAGFK